MIWPFRKKNRNELPQESERSPGGSRIIRHDGKEFSKPQIGFLGEETAAYATQRERIYDEMFGKSEQVFHEIMPLIPHIDVYQYKPGHMHRDFWTLVTSGMSDLLMTLPPGISDKYARTELIFYCDEPLTRYANLLRFLAHYPHDNKTWLAAGHTMPNGNPPSPLFSDTSQLDTILFTETILSPDKQLSDRLRLGNVPVNLLWVIPITTQECELKLQKGMAAIDCLFNSCKHPHVFTGDRQSYI